LSSRFRSLSLAIVLVALAALALLFWPAGHPRRSTEGGSDTPADFAAGQIERGRYLAVAGNCASCHTVADGGFMAGGVAFTTPFGTIYSTNITPDPDTGIGSWTAQQFLDSMRHGIRPDGQHLYPVFPYTAFTKVVDEDVIALFAYLKSLPSVRQPARDNELSFPYNQRWLMTAWKKLYFANGAFEPDAGKSVEWNRGAYLVEGLAHCSACHSPRNFLGAEQDHLAMSGGEYTDHIPDGSLRAWSAPNLTSADSGLGLWPLEEVATYLKTGRNRFVATFGPMNEVILNSTQYLDDADIMAMAVYLKSLPAIDHPGIAEPGERVLGMGRTLYNLHCGTCHLPTGLGDEDMAPRLGGGSLVVRASNPASLINVILYSPELPDPPLSPPWRKPMDEFQYLLDDDEVAALASFVRHSWGNGAGAVASNQVADQR